jgi:orotidine-5'-phosphate decarboxylase
MSAATAPAVDSPESRLVFALDYPSLGEARAGAARVRGAVGVLKVGLELFARGPLRAIARESGALLLRI